MSNEVEKLKKDILPKLSPDLSIELQKSIVQYELQNFKGSLQSIYKTLNKFLVVNYFRQEPLPTDEEKSIADMLRDLKTRNIEVDREISTPLLRVDSKLSDIDSADSVIVESCMDACNTIFQYHIEKLEKNKQEATTSGSEVSKYVLEEVMDMYVEEYTHDSLKNNLSRVKSLVQKYPDNKQIRELYLFLLHFESPNILLDEIKLMLNAKINSIRLSAVIIVLLAKVNQLDEALHYLDLFEKEYQNETEIKYAKVFIYISNYINKNKPKDLEKADAILSEVDKKDDYFINFIFTSHQIVKFNKKEMSEFRALNNRGFFLEMLRTLSLDYIQKKKDTERQYDLKNSDLENDITKKVIENAEKLTPIPPKPEPKKLSEYEILTFNLPAYYKLEFSLFKDSGGSYEGKFNWTAFFFTWIWGLIVGLGFPAIAIVQLVSSIFIAIVSAATDSGFWSIVSYANSIGWGIYWGKKGNYFYYNKLINKVDV